MLEVTDAPQHLSPLIAAVGQRHDHVIVSLGNSRAVPAEALATCAIGFQNGAIGFRLLRLHPGEQRRAEVEADVGVIIDDALDISLGIQNARSRIGSVTLGGNALVPVVERISGILDLNRLQPGVLARRLIEMSMYTDIVPG